MTEATDHDVEFVRAYRRTKAMSAECRACGATPGLPCRVPKTGVKTVHHDDPAIGESYEVVVYDEIEDPHETRLLDALGLPV